MKKFIKILLFIIGIFLSFSELNASSGDIDLIVSPIKYEIKANPGDIITKTADIFNKNENGVTVTSFSANFYSNGTTGAPSFAKDGSVPDPNTELASWISVSRNSIYIETGKSESVDFFIKVPANATPGGHYGAVFFKYSGDRREELSINADYGIIILVTVNGEIIDSGSQGDVGISSGGGLGDIDEIDDNENVSVGNEDKIDDCTVDLTKSNTDGKCFDSDEAIDYVEDVTGLNSAEEKDENTNKENTDKNNSTDNQSGNKENDNIIFDIPFNNEGNTHIKPKGEIIIKDENGKNLKAIGKEYIKNEIGEIVGEKILDYIPINNDGGNVLPNTKRIFKENWKGFFTIGTDENGEAIIIEIDPEKYFSEKYSTARTNDLYPWERICEKQERKKLKAIIKTNYKKYNGEEIEFNSAKNFEVRYKKRCIGINPYFFILVFILGFILGILFLLLFGRKNKKCKNKKCRKKLKKDMKICPYCGTKQKE